MATPAFKRALALLTVVVAVGSAALYLAPGPQRTALDGASEDEGDAAFANDDRGATPAAGDLQRRLMRVIGNPAFGVADHAAVEALLAEAGRAELEALARLTAALPPIDGPRFALETALARYAE